MKRSLSAFVTLFAFSLGLAHTPAERINALRSCDSITISRAGKDPVIVFGKSKVRPLVVLFNVDAKAAQNSAGGKRAYIITFFKGESKKPVDTLWVKADGVWGFQDLVGDGYGRNPKIVEWIEKAIKG